MTALARRRPRRAPRALRYRIEGAYPSYPWEAMRVGDWLDVPVHVATRSRISWLASKYAQQHRGYRFSTAVHRDDVGREFTRVTRVPVHRAGGSDNDA